MTLRLLSCSLAMALICPMGSHAQGPSPSFKSAVDVVSLNVTVMDRANRYVTDLSQPDFDVYEDGVKQDLSVFNRSYLPVALSFVIDTSSSMEERMVTAQDAAVGFVRKLRPADLGEVVGFDSHVQVIQPFTNNPADLELAIRKTVAGGSTALYNAVYLSLKDLAKITARQEKDLRRQAIILFTDGQDTSSLITLDDVLDVARRSETTIYPIALVSEPTETKSSRDAMYAVRQLATVTGGRAFFPSDIKSLASVYGQIYDEISSQYTIGYTSKNARHDGAWRTLSVQITRPNVTARTKQGYFAAKMR